MKGRECAQDTGRGVVCARETAQAVRVSVRWRGGGPGGLGLGGGGLGAWGLRCWVVDERRPLDGERQRQAKKQEEAKTKEEARRENQSRDYILISIDLRKPRIGYERRS
eukprot:SAG11_NODE_410_length_9703_cov_3.284777_3_plen_109_part_00